MAKAKERDMGSEKLFVDALKAAANNEQVLYLGDKESVETILRSAATEFFEGLDELGEGDSAGELAYRIGAKEMGVFLKQETPGTKGVRKWNIPGAIDKFAAKWAGVDAERPSVRMIGVFLNMIEELVDIELLAQAGELDENWEWQVDAVLTKYALILVGVSLPQQALMD